MEAVTVRESGSLRIAALGDLHCPRTSSEVLRELFHDLASEADVLLLCGDLTDYGKPDEARLLVDQLNHVRPVPVLAVVPVVVPVLGQDPHRARAGRLGAGAHGVGLDDGEGVAAAGLEAGHRDRGRPG